RPLETLAHEHTDLAADVMVIALVGAAVVPAIQGYVADIFHSLQHSFLVSMLCFVYVGFFFMRESKVSNHMSYASVYY
ncbi:L-fucose:H+ symporter permease, partial [Citrobacter freundii]